MFQLLIAGYLQPLPKTLAHRPLHDCVKVLKSLDTAQSLPELKQLLVQTYINLRVYYNTLNGIFETIQ